MKALIVVVALLAGCSTVRDPLGSPAVDPETGVADYPTRAGMICRELGAELDTNSAKGQASGFRCIQVGSEDFTGCVEYDDGRMTYRSPGCND